MKRARYIHINNGVGSGNIGDELMAQEFWKLLPAGVVLDVPVLPEAARYRGHYPKPHQYSEASASDSIVPDVAGLLVGDTPVAEFEGLGYPLGTIGPALSAFAKEGLPVDAIAVGVDRLHLPEARRLFSEHYSAVRSWTVRSVACREALLDLGVPADRIRVAADLAWLFTPNHDTDQWAAEQWASLGIDTGRALLVVNVVHNPNSVDQAPKREIASALDRLASEQGYQIAFLSNETRLSEHYDTGAVAAVRSFMQQPSVEVPVEYYTPQEMVSLLRPAATVLTQRYHMAIQAILAQTIPVCLVRGQKLSGLAQEFKLLACGIDRDEIVERVNQSAARRAERLTELKATREKHRRRAKTALSFLRTSSATPRRSANRTAQPNENPRITVIHMGGLGDLVLSASLLSSLRARYPKSTITVLCRASFAGLIELFPVRPDQVVPVSFDPQSFTTPGEAVRTALAELEGRLSECETDFVITAELEPTWLSWYLASLWRAPVNLACSPLDAPRGLLPILLLEGHLEQVPFDGPSHRAGMVEGDRYRALGMSAGAEEWLQQNWSLAPELAIEGRELLHSLGLKPGEYGVCFPLGAGSTLVKRWPKESFAIALEAATDSFRLPVLLTGESHERESLESHAAAFRAKGANVSVFAGRTDQIPLLAALLQSARFFLGNDTGPAHLAQAFATPGVVIFGGGTWPHYRPWGPGAVGVVQPLDCFGCRWDCAFGRAMCIDAVSTEGVVEALRQSNANPGAPASMVILDHASAEMQQIAGAASQIYKTSQQDRLARFQALVETQYASDSAQLQLVQISGELKRQGRVAAVFHEQQLPAPLVSLSGLEGQLGLIESRLAESVGAAQALVRFGGGGPEPSGPLRSGALSEASQAAEDRLAIIERLDVENQTLRAEADRRLDALIEANRIMAEQQEELNQLLNELGTATAQIAWESERAREFEIAAIARLRAIEEANDLLRLREAEFAKQRTELGSLLGQVEIQGRLLNELQPAAQNRLAALAVAAAEIAEARQAASDRLAAIDDANSLLAREQQAAEDLRQQLALLDGELTLAHQRIAVAEPAAADRLAALEDVNRLLAGEQANAEVLRQKIALLSSELTLANQRIAVAEPAAADRLAALEDVNRLLAIERADAETGRQETARLSGELTLANQRIAVAEPAAAERLAALEDVNRLLATEQANSEALRQETARLSGELTLADQRIAVAEPAAAERLAALEDVNRLLATEQANSEALRQETARLFSGLTLANQRLAIAETAAAERLTALEDVNRLLAAEQTNAEALRQEIVRLVSELTLATQRAIIAEGAASERLQLLAEASHASQQQGERLAVFESAASERLAALEATTNSLHRQMAAYSALRSDFEQVAHDADRARALQLSEREHWQRAMTELRNDRASELSARLAAEERASELQLRASQISSERDRYLRAAQELQSSERELTKQVLAIQTDTLVQSIFRRLSSLF